jgi:hypothetical protein
MDDYLRDSVPIEKDVEGDSIPKALVFACFKELFLNVSTVGSRYFLG